MSKGLTYNYSVLRYVHDVLTGEFINVGVVMYVPEQGRVFSKLRSTITRLRGVFPDLDRAAFLKMIGAARRGFRRIGKINAKQPLFVHDKGVMSFAHDVLPLDDSSLQWSPVGAGVTDNPEKTFDRLYERFVARYDTKSTHRRTDDEIWRPVWERLEERALSDQLTEKVFSGSVDDIAFKHAWKNGQWHVYEPLSFDLANADGIKKKAREWLGHLTAVASGATAEPFKAHFIVGAPTDPQLSPAYRKAIEILKQAPNAPAIFDDTQVDEFVAQIEDEVRSHERGSAH